jgi:uncharacterized protein YcgL (UPF0745 family)
MYCAIYKSSKKQDTYLYVATKEDFARVPKDLLQILGDPIHVMDLELSPARKLAREDVVEVIQHLQGRGWHLQLSPKEGWLATH